MVINRVPINRIPSLLPSERERYAPMHIIFHIYHSFSSKKHQIIGVRVIMFFEHQSAQATVPTFRYIATVYYTIVV